MPGADPELLRKGGQIEKIKKDKKSTGVVPPEERGGGQPTPPRAPVDPRLGARRVIKVKPFELLDL